MDLRRVLFIGKHARSGSAQIRCLQIAERLGCDVQLGPWRARDISEKYAAFVCVNPIWRRAELAELAQRGIIIWDILDQVPPRENVAVYLSSSRFARRAFRDLGRVELIPHHHCNFSGEPNPPDNRRPAWIGIRYWHPPLPSVGHDTFFVDERTHQEVVQMYRQTGIGLNLRAPKPSHDFHVAINSGVKLLNCLGFGIPSVSSEEPAYREFGEGCTIFSTPKRCAKWVRELQNDDDLYFELRRKCLRRAPKFHRDAIAEKYRKLLESL
jgi:hypothetical protein